MEEKNQSKDDLKPEQNVEKVQKEQKPKDEKTENSQREKNANPTPEVQTEKTSNFNISSEQPIKKKGNGKKALLTVIILLVIAIAAGLIYYFAFYTKPEQVYKRAIGSTIDSYTNKLKDTYYRTSKTSFKLDANIDTDASYIDEEVLDLINKIDIALDVQTDNENKQMLVNLNSNYDKESLLNLQMYSNIEDEETYVYLKDLLNKYIQADMDDEFYSSVSELLDNQKDSVNQKEALQKPMKILKSELMNVIKPEYCSSQNADIQVNNQTIGTTKNTIKMTTKQLKDEFLTVLNNLKNNEEFLNSFEDKDYLYDTLETLIDEYEELDVDSKTTIEFNLYTKGLLQETAKFEIKFYSEEIMQAITLGFTETGDNSYYFEASLNDSFPILTGTINVEEKNENEGIVKVSLNVQEFGKIELNMEYSQKYNEDVDNVDVKNSVKLEDMTSTDQNTLATNLQKSKLYELIESFVGANSSLMGTTVKNNTIADIDDEDDDEKATTKDNEIISYNDKYKITFKIPSGYKSRYVSDNYRSLDKDSSDTAIKIATAHGNKDKYYEDLQQEVKYYTEESDDKYNNVELSNMESIEVNGRTFYYATFKYEYTSGSYTYKSNTKYIWSEISNDYVVDLEIENADDVTQEELNEVLIMTVENN